MRVQYYIGLVLALSYDRVCVHMSSKIPFHCPWHSHFIPKFLVLFPSSLQEISSETEDAHLDGSLASQSSWWSLTISCHTTKDGEGNK